MKITISKSQWQTIGKITGWTRTSQNKLSPQNKPSPPQIKKPPNVQPSTAQAQPVQNPNVAGQEVAFATDPNDPNKRTAPNQTTKDQAGRAVGKKPGVKPQLLTDALDQALAGAFNTKNPDQLCDPQIQGFCGQQTKPRVEMPNFSAEDTPKFLAELQQKHPEIKIPTTPTLVDPDNYSNSQKNVQTAVVSGLLGWEAKMNEFDDAKKPEDEFLRLLKPPMSDKYIVATQDGLVLDGHHRWAAAKAYNALTGKNQANLPAIVIPMAMFDDPKTGKKGAITEGLESPLAARQTDMDDTIKPTNEPGMKWQVLALHQPINPQTKQWTPPLKVQNAFIDSKDQYVVGGRVMGKYVGTGEGTGIYPLQQPQTVPPSQPQTAQQVSKNKQWYKQAKNIVNINEVIPKIKNITPLLMQDIESFIKTKRLPRDRSLTFTDPYNTKQEKTVTFKIKPKQIKSLSAGARGDDTIYIYVPLGIVDFSKDPQTGLVIRDPQTGGSVIKKKPDLFTEEDLYNVMIHEITHIIDPKTVKFPGEPFSSTDDEGAEAYYSNPKEIDAFQTEIANEIINAIQNQKINEETIMNYLRGSQINLQGILSPNALSALNYWSKNSPNLIRLLKQRLYSALQKNKLQTSQKAASESLKLRLSQLMDSGYHRRF